MISDPISLFQPVERETRRFNPLRIPRKLQAALPFASKPKMQKPQRHQTYMQKRAVVQSPEEARATQLLAQVRALQKVKVEKRREKNEERKKVREKRLSKDDRLRSEREKRETKEHFRAEGMKEKRKAEAEASGGRGKKRRKSGDRD